MILDKEKHEISFKSSHENFMKEASGDKPYTVRVLTDAEWAELKELEALAVNDCITIVIYDSGSDALEPIRRQVRDISVLEEGLGHVKIGIAFKVSYKTEEGK